MTASSRVTALTALRRSEAAVRSACERHARLLHELRMAVGDEELWTDFERAESAYSRAMVADRLLCERLAALVERAA